tara:strand:+ start:22681 stop:23997 length:1317 start_codon:yes stop_codon:yes gene_type:complete
MKIEYINHACVLITTKSNKKILTDPWLHGPSWANNLWLFPKSRHNSDYFKDIDYLYISHGHEDHLHKSSIDWLPDNIKDLPVIMPDFGAKYFVDTFNKYGFSNLLMLKDEESLVIDGDIEIKMFINQDDHDSSLLLSTDNTNVFFQTDNLMGRDNSKRIASNHNINLCFTITSQTGPFPGFYKMNEVDMGKAVIQKRENSKVFSANLISDLKPKYIVPYASDVCYFDDDFFANSLHCDDKHGYKSLVESDMPSSEVIIMNPHDSFIIEDGLIETRDIKKDRVQNNLEEHYKLLKDEVDAVALIRSKDNQGQLSENTQVLHKALSVFNHSWDGSSFNVIWDIKDSNNKSLYIDHRPGNSIEVIESADGLEYDLYIYLDLYRLKHLINNDYAMGFLSLWNGGFKCKRNSLEYNPIEKKFWRWVRAVTLHLGGKLNDNEHS